MNAGPLAKGVLGDGEIVRVADVQNRREARNFGIPFQNGTKRNAHPHDDLIGLDLDGLVLHRDRRFFLMIGEVKSHSSNSRRVLSISVSSCGTTMPMKYSSSLRPRFRHSAMTIRCEGDRAIRSFPTYATLQRSYFGFASRLGRSRRKASRPRRIAGATPSNSSARSRTAISDMTVRAASGR